MMGKSAAYSLILFDFRRARNGLKVYLMDGHPN